jgi:hypothetical protein
MPPPKKKKKPIDLERMKAQLMENQETIGIAKTLGIPLEDYVAQVLHFVANPDAEPQMLVVEDADLKAQGFEVPDAKEMLDFANQQVEILEEAGELSAYKKSKEKKVDLGTRRRTEGDEEVSQAGPNPELKEAVEKELRDKRRRRKG